MWVVLCPGCNQVCDIYHLKKHSKYQKSIWRFFSKLKIKLPYSPAQPLLGTYPKESTYHTDTCTSMFIAILFAIVRKFNHPKYPSTDEMIKKIRFIFTVEFYSAIRKNKIMSFVRNQMKRVILMLSEINQI